jgi:hypothetical protein
MISASTVFDRNHLFFFLHLTIITIYLSIFADFFGFSALSHLTTFCDNQPKQKQKKQQNNFAFQKSARRRHFFTNHTQNIYTQN